jgi:hypothetical protein
MRRLLRLALAVAVLAAVVPARAAEPVAVQPEVVAPETTWDGQQYAGADTKGRFHLLDAQRLRVYPLKPNGELGEPEELTSGDVDSPAPVLDARMDRHGDWVLLFGNEVRWFRSGEEVPLPPLGWVPAAVALLDGQPLVAVLPQPMGRADSRRLLPIPRLLTTDGSRWSVVAESHLDALPDRRSIEPHQENAAHLLVGSGDTVWLAGHYRYRLAAHSAAGRELLTVELDGGRVRHRGDDDPELERSTARLERARARTSEPERARSSVNTALPAIVDLAEGPDGRLYLLVDAAGGGPALDRFDRLERTLERVPLALDLVGATTLVAGRDGLLVVPFNGRRPRHLVTWDVLAEADWRPVEGVVVDGWEVEVSER